LSIQVANMRRWVTYRCQRKYWRSVVSWRNESLGKVLPESLNWILQPHLRTTTVYEYLSSSMQRIFNKKSHFLNLYCGSQKEICTNGKMGARLLSLRWKGSKWPLPTVSLCGCCVAFSRPLRWLVVEHLILGKIVLLLCQQLYSHITSKDLAKI
jgi:hypothetical protein